MAKNNFSPLVNKADVPSSPRNSITSSLSLCQDVSLPAEVTTTPRRRSEKDDEDQCKKVTESATSVNALNTAESSQNIAEEANKKNMPTPPTSPALNSSKEPPTPPPSMMINDAVSPIDLPENTDNQINKNENRDDTRPLPSKSVRREGALVNRVGQKLEETIENYVGEDGSVSTTSTQCAVTTSDSTTSSESSTRPSSRASNEIETTTGINGIDSPMPLFTFSDGKVTKTNENNFDLIQKPPSGPKPTTHRPHTLSSSTSFTSSKLEQPVLSPPSVPSPTQQPPPEMTQKYPKKTLIQRPKTGINVPMIYPPPHHIRWVPDQPEVLHVARDRLVASMMEHDANRLLSQSLVRNRVVYDSIEPPSNSGKDPATTTTESTANIGNNTTLKPYYKVESKNDTTLIFESRFESGNLRRAIQVYDNGK